VPREADPISAQRQIGRGVSSFVGLGRWPFRRAVNDPAQAKTRR